MRDRGRRRHAQTAKRVPLEVLSESATQVGLLGVQRLCSGAKAIYTTNSWLPCVSSALELSAGSVLTPRLGQGPLPDTRSLPWFSPHSVSDSDLFSWTMAPSHPRTGPWPHLIPILDNGPISSPGLWGCRGVSGLSELSSLLESPLSFALPMTQMPVTANLLPRARALESQVWTYILALLPSRTMALGKPSCVAGTSGSLFP